VLKSTGLENLVEDLQAIRLCVAAMFLCSLKGLKLHIAHSCAALNFSGNTVA
jgi:hypothetical protein